MKTEKKRIEEGEKIYDAFVKTFHDQPINTPRTGSLVLFYELNKQGFMGQLYAEMCREYASNFHDGLFVKGSTIHRGSII